MTNSGRTSRASARIGKVSILSGPREGSAAAVGVDRHLLSAAAALFRSHRRERGRGFAANTIAGDRMPGFRARPRIAPIGTLCAGSLAASIIVVLFSLSFGRDAAQGPGPGSACREGSRPGALSTAIPPSLAGSPSTLASWRELDGMLAREVRR